MTKNNIVGELPAAIAPYVLRAPAYHKPGPDFIRKLKAALESAECAPGQKLQQKAFGATLGIRKSTIHDWFEGPIPDQMRALLCGLERLSERQRTDFLREFLRDCPRLDTPELAHNLEALETLNRVLSKESGLVLIQCAEAKVCEYLFTVVGNSMGHIRPNQRICGIDIHFPKRFSPVPGLYYLHENTAPKATRVIVRQIWFHFGSKRCEPLMLRGVLATAPEIWPEILKASRTRQVILAEAVLPELPKSCCASQVTIFAASQDGSKPGTIGLRVLCGIPRR